MKVAVSDKGLRKRIEYLLEGDLDPRHLERLLLFVKDKNGGAQTIRELGDFSAHNDRRERGITTEYLKSFSEQNYPFDKPNLSP